MPTGIVVGLYSPTKNDFIRTSRLETAEKEFYKKIPTASHVKDLYLLFLFGFFTKSNKCALKLHVLQLLSA